MKLVNTLEKQRRNKRRLTFSLIKKIYYSMRQPEHNFVQQDWQEKMAVNLILPNTLQREECRVYFFSLLMPQVNLQSSSHRRN